MSRNMQLKITVSSFYEKSITAVYPNLARHLERIDKNLIERDPSLYELTKDLDLILYRYDGTQLRQVLMQHKDDLKKCYRHIEKKIAEWDLSAADQLLYQLEDQFMKIEEQLD